ncbi:MAG: hypothetical protein HDT14_07830 [Oscillibacter sp.]|nr:hypothetical protein [Oscillibacter sp.]
METEYQLALTYQPHIWKDRKEPFPIRYFGYTVFRERGASQSFKDLTLDPAELGAAYIVEYAVYYDYDIQHLYDLEHVWVAADPGGAVTGCWNSFHGMRLRAHRIAAFRLEGTHPVLYAQPGKHALMPDPALFWLHQDFPESCGLKAGGGLLIPPMLADAMETSEDQDRMIERHIRTRYAFSPALEYEPETVGPEQVIPWPQLLAKIPELVAEELRRIRQAGGF